MEPQTQFVPVDLNPAATEDALRNASPADDAFRDDDLFAPLDLRGAGKQPFADQLSEIANEEELESDPGDAPPPELPSDEPPAPPAPPVHTPEVTEMEDGSILTVEKTNKGWRAILDSGIGNAEVFYGKTKDEMWMNVAAAKVHATRHIRELNKKIKLTARPEATVTQQVPITQSRQLTADEIFEIKNQVQTDPTLAFDSYFQKRTGLTLDQLVDLANEGRQARVELEMEATAREFKSNHPEYLQIDRNYLAMVGWLAKYKLNRTLTPQNQNEIMGLLYHNGAWTAENLEEAFQDLAQDELLELSVEDEAAPETEEEQAVPLARPTQAPAPPAPNPRIARVRVGPRAGLGIRTRETTSVPTDSSRPPSAEELDNLSDAEISKLFSGVRRAASQSARR